MLSILAWVIIVVVALIVVGAIVVVAIDDPDLFWEIIFPTVATIVMGVAVWWALCYLIVWGG